MMELDIAGKLADLLRFIVGRSKIISHLRFNSFAVTVTELRIGIIAALLPQTEEIRRRHESAMND